VKRTLQRQV
jgi:hypothetical protein